MAMNTFLLMYAAHERTHGYAEARTCEWPFAVQKVNRWSTNRNEWTSQWGKRLAELMYLVRYQEILFFNAQG